MVDSLASLLKKRSPVNQTRRHPLATPARTIPTTPDLLGCGDDDSGSGPVVRFMSQILLELWIGCPELPCSSRSTCICSSARPGERTAACESCAHTHEDV